MQHSAFSRAVLRVRQDDQFTVQEMAEVADVSERHMYDVCDQDKPAELDLIPALRLSRYLSRHGENRPARQAIDPRYVIQRRPSGEANGTTEDELRACVRAIVGADRAHKDRDVEAMRECLNALDEVRADLDAELNALLE
jgi:MoxR-like ATPase